MALILQYQITILIKKRYINHIRSFDLYVMSSYTEGLSRTLLDCMNQGVLSVSSDAGGSKKFFKQ